MHTLRRDDLRSTLHYVIFCWCGGLRSPRGYPHQQFTQPTSSNTQLTRFVVRGPRASQPCTISKDVESR